MSKGSAAGMKHLSEAHLSVQLQAQAQNALRIQDHILEEEAEEDRDYLRRMEALARQARTLPIGIVEDGLRNVDQFEDHHHLRHLLEQIIREVREHLAPAHNYDLATPEKLTLSFPYGQRTLIIASRLSETELDELERVLEVET